MHHQVMAKTIPCKVTYDGIRYQIGPEGVVMVLATMTPVDDVLARLVRTEASRQRRNRNARERHSALTGLGLVKVRGALGGVYYE